MADEGDSYNCCLGTGVLGGRPSWKMTGLQVQSGYSRFSLVAGLAQFDCNVRPGFSWRRALENSLSVALSTLLSGQPMYVLVYCAALSLREVRWSEMESHVSLV